MPRKAETEREAEEEERGARKGCSFVQTAVRDGHSTKPRPQFLGHLVLREKSWDIIPMLSGISPSFVNASWNHPDRFA